MLNFTYKEKDIMGEFNGRFIFRAANDSAPLPIVTFNALTEGTTEAWEDATLRHEFFHWLAFRHSKVGIEIVGRRFHARKAFAKNSFQAVIDYYVARTCYFHCVYQCHEEVVEENEKIEPKISPDKLKDVCLTSEQILKIQNADLTASNLIKELGVLRGKTGRLLDKIKGKIATKEYGLQSYFKEDSGQVRLKETAMRASTKGIINAAFDSTAKSKHSITSLLKSARRALNTEKSFVSIDSLAHWAVIKFQTELKTLKTIFELRPKDFESSPTDLFSKWCRYRVIFILRHTLSKFDAGDVGILLELLLNAATSYGSESLTKQATDDLARLDKPFLNYFFTHGN